MVPITAATTAGGESSLMSLNFIVDGNKSEECHFDHAELVKNAQKHIQFLEKLHAVGITLAKPSLRSLKRYKMWLWMLHGMIKTIENNNKLMIPPADVAWLWHCHRLAPLRYVEYLQNEFSNRYTTTTMTIEADPPFEFQHPNIDDGDHPLLSAEVGLYNNELKDARIYTRKVWSELYPNEEFHPSIEVNDNVSGHHEQQQQQQEMGKEWLLSGFDLMGSTERQAGFLWQVTQPNFGFEDFLREGVEQYYKFLCLRRHASSISHRNTQMIVPTYQIDLIWHTHILSCLQTYFADCRRILHGDILHHDDSLNDRTEGGSLDQAFRATKKIWSQVYDGEHYYCEGGMYRGEPPSNYFDRSWPGKHRYDQASSIGIGPWSQLIHIHGATSTSSTNQQQQTQLLLDADIGTWQFQDNDGSWKDYGKEDLVIMEVAYQNDAVYQPITIESSNNWTYQVDLQKMRQLNPKTNKERTIRRVYTLWEYQDDDKTWKAYSTKDQQKDIEGAYQSNSTVTLSMGNWTYEIDTASVVQTNVIHAARKQRAIRRQSYSNIVMGSTSTSRATSVSVATPVNNASVLNAQWTNPGGTAPDGKPGFLPPNPKSTTRGVNSNTLQDSNIFGKGGQGLGYYHQTTRDAYVILHQRILVTEQALQQSIACDTCCGGQPSQRKVDEFNRLMDTKELVKVRMHSDVPIGDGDVPDEIKASMKSKRTYNDFYSDTGFWYFPQGFYDSGGGK